MCMLRQQLQRDLSKWLFALQQVITQLDGGGYSLQRIRICWMITQKSNIVNNQAVIIR